MVIHQIFPKFAPRNQNVTDMKITTFNPDGSIKEVREHHFQIPKYITSFDPNQSFLNIKEEELALMTKSETDMDKDMMIKYYRKLLEYDLSIYIRDYPKSYMGNGYIKAADNDKIIFYDGVLSYLLSLYNKPHDAYNTKEKYKEIRRFLKDSRLWVDTLWYHAKKTNFDYSGVQEISNGSLSKSLADVIQILYSVLEKSHELGLIQDGGAGVELMHALYPFTDIPHSLCLSSNILENDDVVVKMAESLYWLNEGNRDLLYALAHIIDLSSHTVIRAAKSSPFGFVSMITDQTTTSNEKVVVLPANPTNGIEMTEIELSREEIVSIICRDYVGSKNFTKYENEFKQEYEDYYNKNSSDLNTITERQAKKKFRTNYLIPQQWSTFYYDSLDDLESQYKRQYENHKELSSPFCYYYLLVNMCDPGNRYEFKDDFLIELVNLAIKEKCTDRCELYKQMLRLNYMEESAYMIPVDKTENQVEEATVIDNKRNELLAGENISIVNDLLQKSIKFISVEDAIERILVFLSPLYDKRYMVKSTDSDISLFCNRLKILLKRDEFAQHLEPKEPKTDKKKNNRQLGFNVKLVLNIIGVLSKEKDEKFNNPLKNRIANPLCTELGKLWYIEKYKGYNSYINKYLDNKEAKNENQMYESFSLLDNKMIETIKEQFSL